MQAKSYQSIHRYVHRTLYREGGGKTRQLIIFTAWLAPEQAGCRIKPFGKLIQFLGLSHKSPATRIHLSILDATVALGTHATNYVQEKKKKRKKTTVEQTGPMSPFKPDLIVPTPILSSAQDKIIQAPLMDDDNEAGFTREDWENAG